MNTIRTRGVMLGFVIVFAVLLFNSAVTLLNFRRLQETNERVDHAHEVLLELATVLAAVTDAETGQRGFLITGAPEYLEPYRQTLEAVRSEMSELERLTADDPAQRGLFAELRRLVDNRLELIRVNVETREQEGPDAAREMVMTGRGREAMEAVREHIDRMRREEERRLARALVQTRTAYRTALITSLITSALGLALVAVGFMLVRREIAIREQAAAALRESNDRLEERVRERTATISRANEALREEVETRRQAEQRLKIAAAELARSNRELEQFASVASHDLQEPLRKIQAFGDRLQLQCAGQIDDKGRDYLERMLASAGRMRKLIDDLLTYSRAATRVQNFARVNLGEIAEGVVGDLEDRLHESRGRVEIGALPTIEAEPVQMRQLLQNLIANGLKFHRPGVPPVVRVSSRLVAGDRAASDGEPAAPQCEITVADNGIGFDPMYADRIFDLFQRLHGRHEYEGTGMGLAICRKIAERHSGRIAAASVPGEGARFVVTLPVEQPPPSVASSTSSTLGSNP